MSLDTLLSPDQIPYEEALLQNGNNETLWLEYFEKYSTDLNKSKFILSRAVSEIPASTLLWNAFLQLSWAEKDTNLLIHLYKKALSTLNDTPAFWFKYLELLEKDDSESGRGHLKSALDSALFNLERSQHGKIWQIYLQLADKLNRIASAKIYARFYEILHENIPDMPKINGEQCILKVAEYGDYQKAIELFLGLKCGKILSPKTFTEFTLDFLQLLVTVGDFKNDTFMEENVTNAARDSPDYAKHVFLLLANYYSSRQNIEKTRHFHALAFASSVSVTDIVSVFDAVSNWEENQMERLYSSENTEELELRMKLFRRLLDQQPVLINDVLIKVTPHSIDNWLDRAKIYASKGDQREVINTYVAAIRRVNPFLSSSKNGLTMANIWLEYAEIYLSQGDLSTANVIFSHAIKSQFKTESELAAIHIAWTEMIFSVSDEDALKHIEEVLYVEDDETNTNKDANEEIKPAAKQLHRNGDLWNFYIDVLKSMIEENGDNSKIYKKLNDAYSRLLALQIISLRMLLDYAEFLEIHEDTAKSSAIYESGIKSFQSPQAQFHIWTVYLEKVSFKTDQDDAIRDLFERCLSSELPGFQVYDIYERYFTFEIERKNLVRSVKILRNALSYLTISFTFPRYTRENRNKIADDKYLLYSKLSSVISHSLQDKALYRETMSEALQDTHLTVPQGVQIGLEFIEFEKQENEMQRVRALFKFLAGLAHPDSPVMKNLWTKWEEWEVEHGSENSYKQLLKTRRQIVNENKDLADAKSDFNPMGFVIGEQRPVADQEKKVTENPDAIELDMDM